MLFDEFHFCLTRLCVYSAVLDVRQRIRKVVVAADGAGAAGGGAGRSSCEGTSQNLLHNKDSTVFDSFEDADRVCSARPTLAEQKIALSEGRSPAHTRVIGDGAHGGGGNNGGDNDGFNDGDNDGANGSTICGVRG